MASIRFCGNCNNLLYPKEDPIHRVLLYMCRNCGYVEETRNPIVFRHNLTERAKETPGVTQDLQNDPTLPRALITCPHCNNNEAVFYQSTSRHKDAKMTLFYVCTRCETPFQDERLVEKRARAQAQAQI